MLTAMTLVKNYSSSGVDDDFNDSSGACDNDPSIDGNYWS